MEFSDIYAKIVLSTDPKPVSAFPGQLILESDTGRAFEWTGARWKLTPGDDSVNDLYVGQDGTFSTIQEAIDFIELQSDSFTALAKSYEDYNGGTAGLSVSDWAVGSNDVTLNAGFLGGGSTEIDKFDDTIWMGVESENQFYRLIGYSPGSDHLFTECNKISAALSAADEPFTLYRENPYTIHLLDNYYNEKITINGNVCVRFKGNGLTEWSQDETLTTTSVITRGTSFTYGTLEFSDISLVTQYPSANWLENTDGWDFSTHGYNTIELRLRDNVTLKTNGVDMFSPGISIGSVFINNLKITNSPSGAAAHILFFTCPGSIEAMNITWSIAPASIGSNTDVHLFDACTARKMVVNGVAIRLDDFQDKVLKFRVVSGTRYLPDTEVSNITVTSSSPFTPLTGDIAVIEAAGTAVADGPVVTTPVVRTSNITMNLPGTLAADLFVYKGLAAQAATVSVSNVHGGKVFNGGLDVITFQTQTTAESI